MGSDEAEGRKQEAHVEDPSHRHDVADGVQTRTEGLSFLLDGDLRGCDWDEEGRHSMEGGDGEEHSDSSTREEVRNGPQRLLWNVDARSHGTLRQHAVWGGEEGARCHLEWHNGVLNGGGEGRRERGRKE